MEEFKIKSSDSDLELVFSDFQGDCFKARIVSHHLALVHDVDAYTDASGVADMMETLASYKIPWAEKIEWKTLDGGFKMSATCNQLGKVTFELEFSNYGCPEGWLVKTQLNTELGQLPGIAKSARAFLGSF